MRRIISLMVFCVFFVNLLAQVDTKAKAILDQVTAKNKSYKSIKAEFIFSMDNEEEEIHEISEGTILLKGNKYRLNIMGVESYFDGTTLYSYLKDAEEVSIREPDAEDESLNPTQIFSIYETGFTYKFLSEELDQGKELYAIALYPIDKEKSFSHIQLKVNKNEMQIVSLTSFGKDGNNITIKLKELIPNLELSDKDFVFDRKSHPNVEVNDMR